MVPLHEISEDDFASFIPWICTRVTSTDPEGWNKHCPLWGHGDVIALVTHKIYGGQLVYATLQNAQEFARVGAHAWNLLPDGPHEWRTVDFCRAQFGGTFPSGIIAVSITREELLEKPGVFARYARVWEMYARLQCLAIDP